MSLINKDIYDDYISSLLRGEKSHCREIVLSLIHQKIKLKELYLQLFQKSLYEVGDLWEKNKISVATEHLATSITSNLMTLAYPLIFSSEKKGKKVIVTSVANEYHEIGARMIADMMEFEGWDSYFIGSNTPLEDIEKMIREKEPDLLALSVALFFNMNELENILKRINYIFPDQKIVLGGQAFRWGGDEIPQKYRNTVLFKDIHSFENYLKTA